VKRSILIIVLALFVLACEEDVYEEMEPAYRQVMTVFGTVSDGSGKPLEGVTVELENDICITGRTGGFLFKGIEVPVFNTVVRAEKKGYYTAVRTFQSIGLTHREIALTLLQFEPAGTINAAEGGRVGLDNGTAVELDAGSLQLPTGEDYEGLVNVHLLHLDPAAPGFEKRIPGGLLGIELSGEEAVLECFGMAGVKLMAEDGRQLQLKTGFPARLTIAAGDNLGSIPASISLWYFDRASGLWQEESIADYDGTLFSGQVDHFSFWSANLSYPAVSINGRLEIAEGNTAGYTAGLRRLTGENSNIRTERIGPDNRFSCKVPANELMELFIRNACGDEEYTAAVGPFSLSAVLEDVVLEPQERGAAITGRAMDCTGQSMTTGIVQVKTADQLFQQVIKEGVFETFTPSCLSGEGHNLRVVQTTTGFSSPWIKVRYADGKFDAGDIAVCDDLTAYILYNIDDTSRLLTGVPDAALIMDSVLEISLPAYRADTLEPAVSLLIRGFDGTGGYRLHSEADQYSSFSIRDPEIITAVSGIETLPHMTAIKGTLDISSSCDAGELLEGSFTGVLADDGSLNVRGQLRIICNW
jgi:hypothetical protein